MASGTEFFYGDCAPNLGRPAKIGWRRLFKYLMHREELEYHLESDAERYRVNPDSRWHTPEYAALFLDAVRKLQVLQLTKNFFDRRGGSFARGIRVLANATGSDFEAFQAEERRRRKVLRAHPGGAGASEARRRRGGHQSERQPAERRLARRPRRVSRNCLSPPPARYRRRPNISLFYMRIDLVFRLSEWPSGDD